MFEFFRKLFGRSSGLPFTPAAGQLVSVSTEDGFAVAKLLAVDAGGVHLRIYAQRFGARPSASTKLPALSTEPYDPEGDIPFSIGHMPISHQSFIGWEPEAFGTSTVESDELEGHRVWQEAGGGYF